MTESALPVSRRIRRAVAGATSVVIGTAILSNFIRLVSSMVLTRLLDAKAFGIFGIVSSVAYVLSLLADLSFEPFIVRNERAADPTFLDEVWTLRLLRALLSCVAVFALAGPIALYTHHSELMPVLRVYSVTFVLDGLSSLAFATAVKTGQLRKLSSLDLTSSLIQTASSIVLAAFLRSYWALLIALLIGQVARTILSYAIFPGSIRRIAFSSDRAKELWKFSRLLMISSVLTIVMSQTDKLVLLPNLPLSTFGLYSLAATLASAPAMLIGSYVSRILLPAYAHAWHHEQARLSEVYYGRKRAVMIMFGLMVGGLIGSAGLVVSILYDPRYAGVGYFLRILPLTLILVFNDAAASEVLISSGRTYAPLVTNMLRIVWLVGGAVFVVSVGHPIWVIWVVILTEIPIYAFFLTQLRRLHILSLREEALGPIATVVGVVIGYLCSEALSPLLAAIRLR